MKICYTDGATSNNKKGEGNGGYAWIILDEDENEIKNGFKHVVNTTNNECELKAIIEVCNEIINIINDNEQVIIYSDSAYCINCYSQKWWEKWENNNWKNSKKQPVANKELWEQLIPFFKNKNFIFKKVTGHSNNKWNNFVDNLAVQAKFLEY